MATIRDVAQLAGVSISTVSLTFGDRNRVGDETARRVWEAARQLGYRPNPLAQNLKRGHSRMIALVVGDIGNPFFARLLKTVERRVITAGYYILVSDTEADPQRELEVLDQLVAQRIAGIVLVPHGNGPDYAARIAGYGTPIVTLDQKIADTGLDFVGSDTRLASTMLTEHLVRLGHVRIAHICGPPRLWTARERIEGFRATLRASGIEPDESLIVDGRYLDVAAYEQTMRLMTRPDRPTAIVAANNVMALGALQAIQELGFSCPNDVSLATIDDVPWSAVIRPPLTMVLQDVEQIGLLATEYLLERMASREYAAGLPARESILTPRLRIGGSTARPMG